MDNYTNKNPLITIIVLSYNNLSYYKECFSSILNQSYSNIELVISDDNSNAFDSQKLLEYIASNNKGNIKNVIINVNKRNIGVVKNYNKALSLSNGQYFFYLAIDDVFYDTEVLSDVVKYFIETKCLIFTGYKDVYDVTMTKYIKTLPRNLEVKFLKENDCLSLYEKLCKASFISGSNTPFSRELIEKYGYLDEDYFYLEDYPRYLSLTKQGCKIQFYDRKLIKYRMGGVTTNGDINEFLRRDLRCATIMECGEYFKNKWNKKWLVNKEVIGWGTGDCCNNSLNKLPIKIKYLVDSNKSIQGKEINGIKIYSPEELLKENKENIFILVFSYSNYFDIAYELENYGFKEEKNYFCCTPSILELVEFQ